VQTGPDEHVRPRVEQTAPQIAESAAGALSAKYPGAPREWAWQWVFPATRFYNDRATGERRRHHLHESVVQRAARQDAREPRARRPECRARRRVSRSYRAAPAQHPADAECPPRCDPCLLSLRRHQRAGASRSLPPNSGDSRQAARATADRLPDTRRSRRAARGPRCRHVDWATGSRARTTRHPNQAAGVRAHSLAMW
jgi:hypothetical protein